MKQNAIINAFNRGIVSRKALARVDLERMRLSSEVQTNFVPRSLGSATFRPGLEYKGTTKDNAEARTIPFVYSADDVAYIEITDSLLRPIVGDAAITRPAVTTTITNGDFSSATGWTITETAGANGTISGGKLTLEAVAINSYVTCARSASVDPADQNVEHGLRIVVDRGPVKFRCGSTSGGEDYITTTSLAHGEHSLAFTPTGATFYVEFESQEPRDIIVDSITVESSGELTLTAPWGEADFDDIRWEQSGAVVYVSCEGYQQRKIERTRGARSWSLTYYEPPDGPFRSVSTDDLIKLSIDKARGNGTLTATRPLFKSGHVGALFRVFTPGYNFSFTLEAADAFTLPIRVNGVGAARLMSYTVTGTFTGSITLQESFIDEVSGFSDVASVTPLTAAGSGNYTSTADNSAIWLRMGFKDGDYTSGSAVVTLTFGTGGGSGTSATSPGGRYGVARITAVNSSTDADVEILAPFSSDVKSEFWYEGKWSEQRGWPSSVALAEGRLWFAGEDDVTSSISDAYENFDPDVDGDAGVIQRSIGRGPVQKINFMLPLSRIMVGGQLSEISLKSSAFDEPLTPTNFSMKDVSTYGSASVVPVKVDTTGLFVDRAKIRLMEIMYDVGIQDYTTNDLNQLSPDLNEANPIKRIIVQRQPDTRVHCIREDGTVAVLLYERKEEVMCWYEVETDGVVEDGFTLPGDYEDQVYYVVRRTIAGSTVRYYEKFAREDECVGGTLNKQADSFYHYSGAATALITGLDHLDTEEVVVWADGAALTGGPYRVSGGTLTLNTEVSEAIIGLSYTWRYKTAKLAYGAGQGTAINQRKRVNKLGLLLENTHQRGIQIGRDFDNLRYLPYVIKGKTYTDATVHSELDIDMTEFGGDWDTDSRVCLSGSAPYPCTALGITMSVTTNDT